MPQKGGFTATGPCKALQDVRCLKTTIHEEDSGFQFVRTNKSEIQESYGEASMHSSMNMMDSFVKLPTCDTPVIEKNRDLRQRRRSSLGLRGKRASSIIANGSIALPHPSISHESFFKHISEDLPEPVRMKQLLIWCTKRALDEQKMGVYGKDSRAASLARIIEEEILNDLIENKLSPSWYNRKEEDILIKPKPHPRNIENQKKIKEFEDKLSKLKEEINTWNRLEASFLSCKNNIDFENPEGIVTETSVNGISFPSEDVKSNYPIDHSELLQWLKSEKTNLEFKVDRLYHSLHVIDSFTQVSNRYATQLLSNVAKAIQDREKQAQVNSGTTDINIKDVLREITRRDD
ncbi:hypothetical protein T552_01365 [Pneumocystis carinii B80]|uniref:Kinetochore protein mis13 n=1 Tax=Pneumocystis carinii (strain B80) TaxID=1408658 RepID=A0A0W4ZM84_PNEC8|nr:hypothetical protein T552_01365 [Pneumocystis carinii B80]KTW29414.1 hypothetical protein T552_01365 [Pneumocystis carinii B80]